MQVGEAQAVPMRCCACDQRAVWILCVGAGPAAEPDERIYYCAGHRPLAHTVERPGAYVYLARVHTPFAGQAVARGPALN